MIGGCCSFECEAERHFDVAKAAEEIARYRKRGPDKTTRLLRDGISRAGVASGGVLDVGAGIGALSFELVQLGMTRAVLVDASPSYLAAAREEATRRRLDHTISVVQGDFLRVGASVASAPVVTLDRVVCCYPVHAALLREALRRADRCFAFSYPRARWYVRAGMALENARRRFAGNPFRTYVHAPDAMASIIRDAGFVLASRSETWTWSVDVYIKPATGSGSSS